MQNVTDIKEVAVWAKIIAAIYHYQNNHRGLSPTDEMIAIEAGLSLGVVRSQMRLMEQVGLLTDSKRWPRHIVIKRDVAIDKIMDVIDPKQTPPAAPPANDAGPEKVHHYSREQMSRGGKNRWAKLPPEERSRMMRELVAKQWAKLTPEQRKERARRAAATAKANKYKAMTLSEKAAHVRKNHVRKSTDHKGRWATTDAPQSEIKAHMKMMSERRWGTASQVETKEGVMVAKKTDRVEIFKRRPMFERAKQIARLIDEHNKRYDYPPSGMWLRHKIAEEQGITDRPAPSNLLSQPIKKMVEEGWLDHEYNCHADFRLTALGRATLLHEGAVKPEAVKPEPQIEQPRNRPETAPTAHPAIEKPPVVTIRGYRPEQPARPPEPQKEWTETYVAIPDLSKIDSLDLAMELQKRGWRVIR